MIILNNDSSVPLYLQIYEQIKEEIISGQISEGSKLPSTRTLSATLNVSRNTVESAYLQLYSEGYVASKAGSRFIVLKLDSLIISKLKGEKLKNNEEHEKIISEADYNNYKYDFQYGNLSADDFPLSLWKKISNKCLSSINAEDMTSYKARKGEAELQIEIMKYLNKSRGVSCNPEQIIISSGMEYCLSILCQLLRGDFNQIALEDPGYVGARDIFINNGHNVIPIGLDKDGINIEELENSSAKIVYITPSHQFPTGAVMPIQKRLKLLDWAIRTNGIIIEDDYDSELRYNSRPIPSIQSIASKESVVYIGTFSKSLSPSLRVNYMVLPQSLMERYDKLFNSYQAAVPIIQQKIIQQFMYLGHWDRHLRKICLSNKRKHDILVHTIHELMGDKVIIHGKNAGLHILLEFNNGLCEEEAIKKARDHGIIVYPVLPFWMRQDRYSNNMILLGFGSVPESEIVEGIKMLDHAWFND
ncbi:PLP-dependent aminotransferase family protein [Clostridium sp. OS1-26]|uniref:MocR-like pyridoxine biosynthesis transcription factor PdxR n=1 Tax=Clostridium sp. OS1-26 TaxID=3070681 RepID=UPI0027E0A810|nr:PLP-dependent aminotransferase family protein [Clostridium sp. OS1-26]WML32938.1 PLP-dependent aminotransferase family protein [Clostridium sp. OS1-26]